MHGRNTIWDKIRRRPQSVALLCCLAMPLCAQQGISDQEQASAAPPANVDGPRNFTSHVESSVKDVLLDQRDIWTSPFRIDKQTALPWILVGGTTAVLLAVDHPVSRALPFSGTPSTVGTDISRFGQWYTVIPAGAAIFGAGWLSHDPKLTETGVSSLEAVLDADIVTEVFKVAARRQRPRDGDGGGHFEKGGSSFPSGHSTQAWAFASVIADEYGERKWVPVLAYTYATSVTVARVMAQEHFTSDVFVGGAIGFFVGRYVVRTHRLRNEWERHNGHANLLPSVQPEFTGSVKMANLSWSF